MITKEKHERAMAAFRERMKPKPIGRPAPKLNIDTSGPADETGLTPEMRAKIAKERAA